jgi:hypothetical protein
MVVEIRPTSCSAFARKASFTHAAASFTPTILETGRSSSTKAYAFNALAWRCPTGYWGNFDGCGPNRPGSHFTETYFEQRFSHQPW